MKILSRILSLAIIAGMGFFYVGCGGSNPEPDSAEKKALAALTASWKIDTSNGASLDATDRTADFSGFTLNVGGAFNTTTPKGPYNYSTSGSFPDPSPWPINATSANWTFSSVDSDTQGIIIRADDNLAIAYTLSNSNANLKLQFSVLEGGFSNSRVNEVNGSWVFNLHK